MLKMLKSAALALACALVATAATAATPTTNYSLQKPQVGADSDQWGIYVNGDLDLIDSTMFAISGVANAACPKAGCTFTGKVNWAAAVAGFASANCPNGTAPSSKTTGDIWCVGGVPHYWDGATDHSLAYLDSSITGNAATATRLQTTRSIATSGDIACSATNFDGSASITLPNCNLPGSGVGAGTYGNSTNVPVFSVDAKGRVTGAFNQPISYPSQLPSQSGFTSAQLVTNGSSASWSPRVVLQAFSCSSSGCTIGNSANVSQFNRLGVGIYQVVFTTAMPNNAYAFFCTVSGSPPLICTEETGAGASFVQLDVTNGSGTHTDSIGNINVLVIYN